VAQEYAVLISNTSSSSSEKQQGLLGIVLDGALADARTYIQTQWEERISTMPIHTQQLLRRLEEEKAYETAEYKEIEQHLSSHFTLRTRPVPSCFKDSIKKQNGSIYTKMQGISEFTIGGVLENWSIVERNSQIQVPAVVLVGEFDSMSIKCSQQVVDSIPKAVPLVVVKRASHCKLLEETHVCIEEISNFLNACEAQRLA